MQRSIDPRDPKPEIDRSQPPHNPENNQVFDPDMEDEDGTEDEVPEDDDPDVE